MRERWLRLCTRLSGARGLAGEHAAVLWHMLEALYAHPPRAYHTLDHVADCLAVLDASGAAPADPDALEFAVFLHDSVYEPGRADNEARSAGVARVMLEALAAGDETRAAVAALIDATRHANVECLGDAALIVDLDLSILGRAADVYDRYAAAIRDEYSFVGAAEYRAGRAAFLAGLLARERLFRGAWFVHQFESPARENLARELARLQP